MRIEAYKDNVIFSYVRGNSKTLKKNNEERKINIKKNTYTSDGWVENIAPGMLFDVKI